MEQTGTITMPEDTPRSCSLDCLYRFGDLSESAQQTVLDANRNRNVEYIEWWDGVYEQQDEKMKAMGFIISDKMFSGFWSQGDGAVILGTISYFDFLKQTPEGIALLVSLKLRSVKDEEDYDGAATFTHSGRYCHEHSYSVSLQTNAEDIEELSDSIHDFVEANIDEWIVELNKEFYRALEAEYDYLTSDECLREHYEHDDDLYDIDGEPE